MSRTREVQIRQDQKKARQVKSKVKIMLIISDIKGIVGFEAFTAVTMKNAIFLDVAPRGFSLRIRSGRPNSQFCVLL
jgi:hypothetical protein